MYVQPSKALAHELRAATILLKNKKLIALLNEAAERIEDLDKIAEHYRVKAEKAEALLMEISTIALEISTIAHEMQEGKAE